MVVVLLSDRTDWGANEDAAEIKSAMPDTTDFVDMAHKARMNDLNSGNKWAVTVIPLIFLIL